MTNREVAQAFANGKQKGKSLHMFIDGDTIYSYGYHFPIARRFQGVILFTNKGYSQTTARHKTLVRCNLFNTQIVNTNDVTRYGLGENNNGE